MIQAKNITMDRTEDISKLQNGDRYLMEISNQQFKCFNDKCSAQLRLCSYQAFNIPSPYFNSISISDHIDECTELILRGTFNISEITSTSNGRRAFNKLLSGFIKSVLVTIYNPSTGTKEETWIGKPIKRENRRSISKIGPVVFDSNIELNKRITYMINLNDIDINRTPKGTWININGSFPVGIVLDDDSKLLSDWENRRLYTIIIIPKFFKLTDKGRKILFAYDYFFTKNGELVESRIYPNDVAYV